MEARPNQGIVLMGQLQTEQIILKKTLMMRLKDSEEKKLNKALTPMISSRLAMAGSFSRRRKFRRQWFTDIA